MKTGPAACIEGGTMRSIPETGDHMRSSANHGRRTSPGSIRRSEFTYNPHDESNHSRAKAEQQNSHQNSHPAWNPDSRWPR